MNLKGKGLFIFSDPGGAKPILALIKILNIKDYLIISDRKYNFFSDFELNVNSYTAGNEEMIIDEYKPDYLFTGTSYTSNIELLFLKAATKKNIVTYSFVDHWTNISKRFIDQNGNLVQPDNILLLDKKAVAIAIQEGIITNKIDIIGNPYHSWLQKWIPKGTKDFFIQNIDNKISKKKILLYAPDPLSNVNGKEKFGFDEISATKMLVTIFEKNKKLLDKWVVIVKPHPNQDKSKLSHLISGNPSFYILADNADTNECIYFSDVVMGFFSSILIESTIINRPVLRFLLETSINDPFEELNIGEVVGIETFISTLLNH